MPDYKGHAKYLSRKLDSEDDEDDDDPDDDGLLSDDDKKEIERIAGDVLEIAVDAMADGGQVGSEDRKKAQVVAKLSQLVAKTKARTTAGRNGDDARMERARRALGKGK